MKTSRTSTCLFLALMLATALISCDTGAITNPEQIVFPDTNVSYSRQVQPLFDLSCAFSGCHDEYSKAGGLGLRSYSDVIIRPGVVVPGNSKQSKLYQIVRGLLPHSYPLTGLINENQKVGIAVWIDEGASNN